jgi:hypothetical protein
VLRIRNILRHKSISSDPVANINDPAKKIIRIRFPNNISQVIKEINLVPTVPVIRVTPAIMCCSIVISVAEPEQEPVERQLFVGAGVFFGPALEPSM